MWPIGNHVEEIRLVVNLGYEKLFKDWKTRLNSDNKIDAICKPCWELKYCPYGSLVEMFKADYDSEYSCRIFGHECPVFTVAEPFTETKDRRNIKRVIPQSIKLKVFRRDNQVCQMCGKNVPYNEIQYDHIIPWSFGGSSDENNIRLVCSMCNKKRGNNYKDEYLVTTFLEHTNELLDLPLNMVEDLLRLTLLWFYLKKEKGDDPDEEEFCNIIRTDDLETDKFMYKIINNIIELLSSNINFLRINKKIDILRYRWGYTKQKSFSILETCQKYKVSEDYFIHAEEQLLRRIGFRLNNINQRNIYLNLKVDKIEY